MSDSSEVLTPARLRRLRRSTLTRARLTALNIAVVTGLAGVSGLMLWDMRTDAAQRADAAQDALVQVLSRDIARNIELLDLSLQAIVDGYKIPAVHDADPVLRRMILFDRAATASNFGAMLIIDEHGNTVLNSRDPDPAQIYFGDREYFQHHRDSPDTSLHVGAPLVSRILNQWTLPLSRRLSHPDGSFAGIALAVIKLDYFRDLLDAAARGGTRLTLFGPDSTMVMAVPYDLAWIGTRVAAGSAPRHMDHFGHEGLSYSKVRGPDERGTVYARVGALPLVIGTDTQPGAVFATWWWKALTLGGIVGTLLAGVLGLGGLLQRELARHEATGKRLAAANAALATLAATDALTGLGNRRRFDEALDGEWRRALRGGRPLSLLLLDADWFKAFNDAYGHQSGDEALRLIGRSITAVLRVGCDTGYRYGGEEFAVILPDTDLAGAVVVAERIRAAVAGWAIPHEHSPYGALSVSCGAAEMVQSRAADPVVLVAAADIALYAAKELGRDRVWSADRATSALRKFTGVEERTPLLRQA